MAYPCDPTRMWGGAPTPKLCPTILRLSRYLLSKTARPLFEPKKNVRCHRIPPRFLKRQWGHTSLVEHMHWNFTIIGRLFPCWQFLRTPMVTTTSSLPTTTCDLRMLRDRNPRNIKAEPMTAVATGKTGPPCTNGACSQQDSEWHMAMSGSSMACLDGLPNLSNVRFASSPRRHQFLASRPLRKTNSRCSLVPSSSSPRPMPTPPCACPPP